MTVLTRATKLYGSTADRLTALALPTVPTLARLVFAGGLLLYFWNSAGSKIGWSATGLLFPKVSAYAQIFPQKAEAFGFNISQFGALDYLTVLAGTWAEILLPLAILIGLLTRLAALGMIGFVFVQSYVDLTGHKVASGAWFDGPANGLVDVRAFWLLALVTVMLLGPGPLSVDRWLGNWRAK